MHKEVCSHPGADRDYEPPYPQLGKPKRVVRAEISPERRARDHHDRLRPENRVLHDEDEHGDSIGRAAENDLESVHLVNVRHTERGQHGEDHKSHASAEVAAIYPDQQLEERRCNEGGSAGILQSRARTGWRELRTVPVAVFPCQFGTEDEDQSRYQHQPGQDSEECVYRRAQQKDCAGNPADHAYASQRDQNGSPNF